MNKRGQLGGLAPAIIGLTLAAVILVLGLVVTQEMTNTVDDVSFSVANESVTAVSNTTASTIGTASRCNFNGFSVTQAINTSNEAVITSNNYTVDASAGTIISTEELCTGVLGGTSDFYCGWDWNVSYTANWGDQACQSSNSTVVGLGSFADFWSIIVLAIVIAIVLGILLAVFGGRRTR